MNNALMQEEVPIEIDKTPWLRERAEELTQIVGAINSIVKHQDWQFLQTRVFQGVVESLEKKLLSEAKKSEPDTMELARVNGQLVWARKYADLSSLEVIYREELKAVRDQLKVS